MTRPSLLYILMIAVCAAGIWLILRLGNQLSAPPDLSGIWTIQSDNGGAARELGETLHIEQSGKYALFNFAGGKKLNVALLWSEAPNSLRFGSKNWDIVLKRGPDGEAMKVVMSGGERKKFLFEIRQQLPAKESVSKIKSPPPDPVVHAS